MSFQERFWQLPTLNSQIISHGLANSTTIQFQTLTWIGSSFPWRKNCHFGDCKISSALSRIEPAFHELGLNPQRLQQQFELSSIRLSWSLSVTNLLDSLQGQCPWASNYITLKDNYDRAQSLCYSQSKINNIDPRGRIQVQKQVFKPLGYITCYLNLQAEVFGSSEGETLFNIAQYLHHTPGFEPTMFPLVN